MGRVVDGRKAGNDARAANVQHFAGGTEVARYLEDSYHEQRLQVAAQIFGRLLARTVGSEGALAIVLDVASGGPSRLASQLYIPGRWQIVSCDVDRRSLLGDPPTPQPSALRFDATRAWPIKNASVAGVFLGEFIEHVFDPSAVLRECRRVLKDGCPVVVTTPNLATLQDRLYFLFGRSPRHINPQHPYLRLHIRPFTLSALKDTMREAGFTVVAVASNQVVWRAGGHRFGSSRLAMLMPSLGGSLIVGAVAR